MTENLLGEQTTDAKSSDTAANNIVAFSRILTREFARTSELATAEGAIGDWSLLVNQVTVGGFAPFHI